MVLPLLQWKRTLGCFAWLWGTTEVSDKITPMLSALWGRLRLENPRWAPAEKMPPPGMVVPGTVSG